MVAAATWIARVKILEFAETRINFGARCVTAVLDNCATHQKGEVQKGEATHTDSVRNTVYAKSPP